MSVLMEGHMKLFNAFLKDESGAVTVDWVVLTAAIVGLGIAVLSTVRTGTTTLAGTISADLAGIETGLEASSGGTTTGGDTSGGDTSGGDTSGGDTSGGDTSGGDTSGG